MTDPSPTASSPAAGLILRRRVTAYILIRLLVVSSLLALVASIVLREPGTLPVTRGLFPLAAITLAFLAVSAALVRTVSALDRFVLVQLLFDAVFLTVLVVLTGRGSSIFVVLYFMNIIAAAYLTSGRIAILVVAVDALAYAGVNAAELGTILLATSTPGALTAVADEILRILAFVLVGVLSVGLANRVRSADRALVAQVETTRALEEEHGLVLQSVASGILVVGSEGRIRSANPAAEAILGSVVGCDLADVMPGLAPEAATQDLAVGSDPRILVCSQSPLGEAGASVVVFEDVTHLREVEAEAEREERLAGVGRIAAAIAHEIRNPLASLSGAIQLLAEDRPGPLVDIATSEVRRLNDLVGDFLDLARPEVISPRSVDADALVREVARDFGADPRYRDSVRVEVAGGIPHPIVADPDRLQQMVWNLLLNAAQAMPRGGPVRLVTALDDGLVHISVQDEGMGMSESDRARLFDPFFTTRRGGTGLGLANVDRLMRAHGGRVDVRSEPGRGSCFTLVFPRQPPNG
ncbi:MAG: PAS domain-containing protein [Deltaproteobacteria bacterium]|nr:PAS domain-containing protein [Deltaproteobacteria bacterium]